MPEEEDFKVKDFKEKEDSIKEALGGKKREFKVMEKNSVKKTARFQCIECDYIAFYRAEIRSHVRKRHNVLEEDCNECIVELPEGQDVAEIADGSTNDDDEVVDPTKTMTYSLKLPSSGQTVKKRFSCSLCTYSNHYRNQIKIHLRLKHHVETDGSHIIQSTLYDVLNAASSQRTEMAEALTEVLEYKPDIDLQNTNTEDENMKQHVNAYTEQQENEMKPDKGDNFITVKEEGGKKMVPVVVVNELDGTTEELSVELTCDEMFTEEGNTDAETSGIKSCVHLSTATNTAENTCKSESTRSSELLMKNSDKFLTCPHCERELPTMSKMTRHIMTIHEKRKRYGCPMCSITTYFLADVKSHFRKRHHQHSLPQDSEFIHFESTQPVSILKPVKPEPTINQGRPIKCGKCPEKFTSADALMSHMVEAHKKKKYFCRLCLYDFGTESLTDLEAHLEHIHNMTDIPPEVLLSSQRKETPREPEQVVEDIEEVNSDSEGDHEMDTNLDKTGATLNVCSECLRVFKRRNHLKKHMLTVHQKVKRFGCKRCSYKSFYFSEMKSHYCLTHTGEYLPDASDLKLD